MVTLVASAWTVNMGELRVTATQAVILVYLGVVAAGVGFLLWNRGATKASAGMQYLRLGEINQLVVRFDKNADQAPEVAR